MSEIEGGADPYVAAAAMAAVQVVVEEMETPEAGSSFGQGAWVLAGRPRSVTGPRTEFSGLQRRREEDASDEES